MILGRPRQGEAWHGLAWSDRAKEREVRPPIFLRSFPRPPKFSLTLNSALTHLSSYYHTIVLLSLTQPNTLSVPKGHFTYKGQSAAYSFSPAGPIRGASTTLSDQYFAFISSIPVDFVTVLPVAI
jgi:hypothetical protein